MAGAYCGWLMGKPAWSDKPRYQSLRAMGRQNPEEVDALVVPLLQHLSKNELEELASRHQLTISPLRTFAEVIATPQLQARGFFAESELAGNPVKEPRLPFKITSARNDAPAGNLASTMLAQAKRHADPGTTAGNKPLAGLRARDMIQVVDLPVLGPREMFRAPWRISGRSAGMTSRGPQLGEHNTQVLQELLGLSLGEIEHLKANGIVS